MSMKPKMALFPLVKPGLETTSPNSQFYFNNFNFTTIPGHGCRRPAELELDFQLLFFEFWVTSAGSMPGTKYQRCSRGCGLICDLASVEDHQKHCTGREAGRLPWAAIRSEHQMASNECRGNWDGKLAWESWEIWLCALVYVLQVPSWGQGALQRCTLKSSGPFKEV